MNPNHKRVHTPVVLQMEAVECGAASLSIILSYYKRYIPLEQLRTECDVNRDGSSASNILLAAEKHGMETAAYKYDLDDFEDQAFPVIVHWNFNHFLVLEGFKEDKVFLNDPAMGHRTVNLQEFSDCFTGIVLECSPSDEFETFGKKSNLMNSLSSRIVGYKKDLIYIFLLGLLLAFPGIIIPVFSKVFVDEILISGSQEWIIPLIVGMIITAIFRAMLEYIKYSVLTKTSNKLEIVTSAKYFWHVIRLPINFFNQRYRGEIGGRITLNAKVAEFLTGKLANNLLDVLLLLFYFSIMLYYDILLSLIVAILAMINIFVYRIITKKRAEGYLNYTVEVGKLSGVTIGGIQTIETLKAMGRENDFFVKWAGYFTKVVNANQKLGVLTIILNITPVLLFSISSVLVLIVGGAKVMDGELTIGMLVAFQSLAVSFSQPIENLVQLGGDIQEIEGDMNRLDDVLKSDLDPLIQDDENQEKRTHLIGHKLDGYIEFKNVTFGYSQNSPPLIENFNLVIKPGERVALVGGSGSGKSTLVRLLAGFYQPWSGEILFDGKPREFWPREVICSSLSMVSQDVFLFEGSIRDVLTIWDTTVTDSMVISATKDACIHDVIASKSNAYDYFISEGGRNLSGGQRQRIAIARALVGSPSCLILDEGTSALDPITEKIVMDNIRKRKCSVFVVAHRLSTIRDSDEIIVLQNGKVCERGIHSDLIQNRGEYAKLIEN